MKPRIGIVAGTLLALAGCADVGNRQAQASDGFIDPLPDGVLAIVDPYQDLSAVKIDPADGCYYYRYAGPVETTFLPLRTVSGSPICSRPAEPAAPEAAPA